MGPARRRMVAVAGGVLVALLAGEAVLRIAVPSYASREPTYEIAARGASWVYEPGSRVVFEWDGDPYGTLPDGARQEIAVNAEGLRGPLPEPWQPSVVVLGDSFTFGEGVADDATIPALLEKGLAARVSPPPVCVNAGVSAHGTIEEAQRVPGLIARFRPRALVLVHVPNDGIPWYAQKERDGADLLESSGGGPLRLLDLLRSVAGAGEVEDWMLSYYTGAHAEDGALSLAALDVIAGECRDAGVPFGVVAHPLLHRLRDDPLAEVTAMVSARCAKLGVPFLDLRPALLGRPERDLWVHPTDHHPNAAANRLSAAAMVPFVEELLRRK